LLKKNSRRLHTLHIWGLEQHLCPGLVKSDDYQKMGSIWLGEHSDHTQQGQNPELHPGVNSHSINSFLQFSLRQWLFRKTIFMKSYQGKP